MVVPPGPPFPEHLHNKTMCGIVWCDSGPIDTAESIFQPVRSFLKPSLDLVGSLPFPALQTMFDPLYPPGLQWYWKADFLKNLSDDAIRVHMKYASRIPSMQSTMHLYPVNGAAGRVPSAETPWSNRDANWAEVIVAVDPSPAKKSTLIEWARGYWEELHPYSSGGAYINFMMDEGEDRIKETYRGNFERLSTIKSRYDPNNLFHINQNIKPAAARVGRQQETV
jgi:hypothetical protein